MTYQVRVRGREFPAEAGESLSEVLIRGGITHPHPCGGRGVCGKCRVTVDGQSCLACRYRVERDITVEIPEESEILSEVGVPETESGGSGTDLVLDIGTTTLALALVDVAEKKLCRVITAKNPQRTFGADVISRIEYAGRHGVTELTRCIREAVCRMIAEIGTTDADTLYVAGNTTMLHIFAGVDPTPMGVAPYTPAFLTEVHASASDYGILGVKHVRLMPSIAPFVGADLVAGIHFVGLPPEKYRLLVDLGTNAEIILFSRDRIFATAAAAGPCFEGANISCGMSATDGAIYAYDGKTVRTVGDKPPLGICGTGLVDCMAYLLKSGAVDESGYMEDGTFSVADGVVLTQEDVRQYQLAKSAIYSAIVTLMRRSGVQFSDIESLYISGGFSAKMNVAHAAYTGLIPLALRRVCHAIGNSSLLGAVKAVLGGDDLSYISERAQYVDLSDDSLFADLFMENMMFDTEDGA